MDQPVICDPSGFTYEKNEIMKHFQVNGNIDPLSRETIKNSEKLIDNKNLKHATEEFLRDNPWAYEHTPFDNLNSIKM